MTSSPQVSSPDCGGHAPPTPGFVFTVQSKRFRPLVQFCAEEPDLWPLASSVVLIRPLTGMGVWFVSRSVERLTAEQMDEQRVQNVAYQYLCRLEEAKRSVFRTEPVWSAVFL